MSNDQQELFKSDFGWFHFFKTIINTGTWARMSLAAGKLYPVLKSYANSENGAAFPSYETLSEMSGLSLQSVSKALKELASLDLIEAKRIVGKKTVYALREHFHVEHPISGKAGTASFEYVPQLVQQAVNEMKALISTGAKGQIIQINFNLNCDTVNSNNAGAMIDGISLSQVDGGKAIQEILDSLEKRQPVENS